MVEISRFGLKNQWISQYNTCYNDNDLEVANPHSGLFSTWFLVKLEFRNVGFWGKGKTGVTEEKPLGARERTNNKLNPHMTIYDHISASLRSLRWLNVKQRLMVNDAVMMHKCLKSLTPSYLSDKFSTRAIIHDRQTRYRDSLLNILSCRINTGQRAFYYRGMKEWNNLSKDSREIINTKIFKTRLINELICNMN